MSDDAREIHAGTGSAAPGTSETDDAELLSLFQPAAIHSLNIERVDGPHEDLRHISRSDLPILIIPSNVGSSSSAEQRRAVVAVEGADQRMASAIALLLNPARIRIHLVHVTWLPRTAGSPLGPDGIDNPESIDLLLYRGAHEALIDAADTLRTHGFVVTTHLGENRHPADGIVNQSKRAAPTIIVLGLGRHGAGIGRDILRGVSAPLLYVAAR